jgi:SAM-dependent methyltransferase
MLLPVYFRHPDFMPELEQLALRECRGKVLDIGAGAGSHALTLQAAGLEVTALDISPNAVAVMKDRGVEKATVADIFTYQEGRFDTLLLLMNGIGLVGTVGGLYRFLKHARTLLSPGGQILFDSSDVAYLYEDNPPEMDHYYGEIACRYEYKKQKSDWFSWLYIDEQLLLQVAANEGWQVSKLFEDEEGQYLVRLTAS